MRRLAAILALLVCGSSAASSFVFTGEADGHSWNLRDNWRVGTADGRHAQPSYADTAVIDPGAGKVLYLSVSNTAETSTWPCHRVYRFLSGTTYIGREKSDFYVHGGNDTSPEIYVAPGATVVFSNRVTMYNRGPLVKTGAGTVVQVGEEGSSRDTTSPDGLRFEIREGAWLMKCPKGYGVYSRCSDITVRDGATLLQQGYNSMGTNVTLTVDAGGTFRFNAKGGGITLGRICGAGTVAGEEGLLKDCQLILTFDPGPCVFSGEFVNVPQLVFKPSEAAKAAGSFRFDAGWETFSGVGRIIGDEDAVRWVSGEPEAVSWDSLFPGGDFNDVPEGLSPLAGAGGGQLEKVTEDGTWNRCLRLSGNGTGTPCAWFGSDGAAEGVPVAGGTLYEFSVELKGGAGQQATIGFRDWKTGPSAADAQAGETTAGTVSLGAGWTRFTGRFTTHAWVSRAALTVAVGADGSVLVDNVVIRMAPDRLENLDPDLRFVAAPIDIDSDYAIPFLPREIFHAPSNVTLKAAVNEFVDLPVAVANLTDRAADYRVVLETVPTDKFNADYTGEWGLEGLEPERVRMYAGVRMKDTATPPASVRYDPLQRAGSACTITVPPREAGLVWFDFDLTDAAPGTYAGRVRVIPLGEPGDWVSVVGYGNRRYEGPLQDIAVELEVRPIVLSKGTRVPTGFFQPPASEAEMDFFVQTGATEYQVSPWSVMYARDANGDLDLNRPDDGQLKAVAAIRRACGWAAKRGVRPTWFVGFSSFDTMNSLYNPKGDADVERRLWPQFVRGIRKMMDDAGVTAAEYAVETFDEPDPSRLATLRWAHEAAREAVPEMRLSLTLGAHVLDAADMRALDGVTDAWTLWDGGYFGDADHLAYIADALSRGKKVGHYLCSTSPATPIFSGYHRHAWFGELHGLTENQFYLLHDAEGGVGERDWKAPTNGGMVYRSFDEFMPSVRYMSFRRGINDVKYLSRLRKVAGSDPEVAAFLSDAARRVIDAEKQDRSTASRVREEAAELLLRHGNAGMVLILARQGDKEEN